MMHLDILIDIPITHVTNLLDIRIPSHPTWRFLLPSFLFYLFIFCHILHPDCRFPSFYPSQPLSLSPRSTPLFPLKKKKSRCPMSPNGTWHNQFQNKTGHQTSCQGRMSRQSRMKGIPGRGKRDGNNPYSYC